MTLLRSAFVVLLMLGGCASSAASARTLRVGPDGPYKKPSAAIAAAGDGDTVAIAPGTYYDCAVVRQDNITIEGTGPGAVMTDSVCKGKAILVIDGNNVTIRNLTLQRARVPDGNGAGIRAEGGNLTIENTRFLDNENGILSAPNPSAKIIITGSDFERNGKCGRSCAHGIYIGPVALLKVTKSRFYDQHVGHNIKSRAARTEVIGCTIADGPNGTSSYLIDIPNGGALVVENNKMEKGPHSSNWANTIMIGEEGVNQATPELIFRNNTLTNDTGHTTVFVHNITATPAQLINNHFKGGQIRPLEGDGVVHGAS